MKALHLLLAVQAAAVLAAPPEPKFKAQDLDKGVQIGYGVAVADVDGDKLPDILLADKKQFRWYKNPGKRDVEWPKYLLAENLTKQDNVCIAAQDIDGDGKCEVAVGAEWNPGDTVNSGAVFYLIPPADRTQPWEAVKFPSVEPTTHRMRWVQVAKGEWVLVVVPLHGRGNKSGEGAGVKVIAYQKPENPKAEWKSQIFSDSLHSTHNFEPAKMDADFSGRGLKFVLGGKEGLLHLRQRFNEVRQVWLIKNTGEAGGCVGVGEVRGLRTSNEKESVVTIEPMHGNQLAFYNLEKDGDNVKAVRHLLTDKLVQGHALACGDLLGVKSDQIVVGWRGGKPGDSVGIAVWAALDEKGEQWRETVIDKGETACEDLMLADFDGDGKLDIVAAGRASHNLRVFWNER